MSKIFLERPLGLDPGPSCRSALAEPGDLGQAVLSYQMESRCLASLWEGSDDTMAWST